MSHRVDVVAYDGRPLAFKFGEGDDSRAAVMSVRFEVGAPMSVLSGFLNYLKSWASRVLGGGTGREKPIFRCTEFVKNPKTRRVAFQKYDGRMGGWSGTLAASTGRRAIDMRIDRCRCEACCGGFGVCAVSGGRRVICTRPGAETPV